MVLTRGVKETIRERVDREPAFREALLTEGIECLLAGDVDTGSAVLRDYINATIGFSGTRRADGQITEKPHAHVGSWRQSPSTQPVRDHRAASEA